MCFVSYAAGIVARTENNNNAASERYQQAIRDDTRNRRSTPSTPESAAKAAEKTDATGWMPSVLQGTGTNEKRKKVLVMVIEVSSVVTSTKHVKLELVDNGNTLRVMAPQGEFMTETKIIEKMLCRDPSISTRDGHIYSHLLQVAIEEKYGEEKPTVMEVAYISLAAQCSTFKKTKLRLLSGTTKALLVIFSLASNIEAIRDDDDGVLTYEEGDDSKPSFQVDSSDDEV